MYDIETANRIIAEQEARIRAQEAQIARLKKYAELLERKSIDGSSKVHNARGAGRKKDNEKMQNLRKDYKVLMDDGLDMEAIMERLQISRSTYYRLKKYWDEATALSEC